MKTEEQFYKKLAEKHAKKAFRALEFEHKKQKLARKAASVSAKIIESVKSSVDRLSEKFTSTSKKLDAEDWTDFEKEIGG